MTVGRDEAFDRLRRVAERGGTLRIAYGSDIDSVSAAAILFSEALRLGARAVARPYGVILDLARVRHEVSEGDLLVAVGLLVKGEPSALGLDDMLLIEPGDYPIMENFLLRGIPGSSALAALELLGDRSILQTIRAIVGHYATRCYLLDQGCGDAALAVASRGGELFAASPETLMLALRRQVPLDAAVSATLYPSMASILGDRQAVAESLRGAGVCDEACPTLEEVEGKRDRMSALRSYLSSALPQDLLPRLTSKRVTLRQDAGVLSDLSDLSLLEEALMFREGPQSSLADSLSSYPRALRHGLRYLLEISKSIPRMASRAAKGAAKSSRAVLVEDANVPGQAAAEVFAKSAAFTMTEGDQLLVIRLRLGSGGTYVVGARRREPLDSLISEAEDMGAHHVRCGALVRLWVPQEEDRRFQSLVS
ncbi:MAG: hypothetical protein ACP5ID_00640 [Conexivisphaera sp.]